MNAILYDRCCLSPGRHTLTCINKKSELGWENFTLEIDGKRYCDDFIGFKAMRTILFQSKKYVSKIQILSTILIDTSRKIPIE